MATVDSLCISKKKGERKRPVESVTMRVDHGIEGDAHAGPWHRQLSILSKSDIDAVRDGGLPDLKAGDFAENIVIDGLELSSLGLGTRLRLGAELELTITQIGKECHSPCRIYHLTGDCIMPKLGLFARVEKGGTLAVGETAEILHAVDREIFQVVVITVSDSCSRGEAIDTAGPAVLRKIEDSFGAHIYRHTVVADEFDEISELLKHYSDGHSIDLIVTVGGTGFSPRDVSPEATRSVIERLTPGLDEAMRAASLTKTPRAMLSRGCSGIRALTLIVNLPGSERAALENLEVLLDSLPHGLQKLRGDTSPCGDD